MSEQSAQLVAQKIMEALSEFAGFDDVNNMFKVCSVQKKFRDSFSAASLNTDKWASVIGTGGAISQAAGVLTMGSGTTANAETSITSKEVFTVPFRASIGLTLSQRIANQSFIAEFISVDPVTLVPDGKHSAGFVFDGTTATQGKYRVQNGGLTPLDSSAVTIPTTAGGSVYEVEIFADESWFHGGTLDSTNARANSYRRHQQLPDPNALYKFRLRWLNGSSVPASNTNAQVQYIAIQDYAELTAEITAGRGQSVAGQAVGVQVAGGTVGISGNPVLGAGTNNVGLVTPALSATTGGGATTHSLVSVASTNATSVKAAAGTINGGHVTNSSASMKYFKLYNKASAPTVGTDTPVAIIGIPATSSVSLSGLVGATGLRLATGIAYAVTGAMAVADTTAVAAGDVAVHLNYV